MPVRRSRPPPVRHQLVSRHPISQTVQVPVAACHAGHAQGKRIEAVRPDRPEPVQEVCVPTLQNYAGEVTNRVRNGENTMFFVTALSPPYRYRR